MGGNGFMGSHLADAFLAKGDYVRVFDRQRELFRVELPGVEYQYADFEDAKALEDALDGVDVVFHLVSTTIPQTSNQNPAFDVQSNVVGTIMLLEGCRRKGVGRVVFISSGGVIYGVPKQVPIPETHPTEPLCSYGITKLAVEKYLALFNHLHGIRYTVFRCANPYGERQNPEAKQGAVGVFLAKVAKGEGIVIWGDGEVVRDFFYISDLVAACLQAAGGEGCDGVYNIGSGEGVSLNVLLDVIKEVTGREVRVRYTPARKLDVPVNVLDISKAREGLGWRPTVGLREGIGNTWDWISNRYNKEKEAIKGC